MAAGRDITQLLISWRAGDGQAGESLMQAVYDQLRALAGQRLRSERPDHTLQTTELVHEAYMRLAGAEIEWKDRVHFFAVAARAMRRILVDHAKAQHRAKRGAGADRVSLEEVDAPAAIGPGDMPHILALDQALDLLALNDQRKSQLVELLFFGGLTHEEAAAALDISLATLHRDLKLAKAWLHHSITEGGG